MSYSPDALPDSDPGLYELDSEVMEIIGPDCRGIGAFAMDSLGVDKMFASGVTALAVTAVAIAGGVKVVRELLGR